MHDRPILTRPAPAGNLEEAKNPPPFRKGVLPAMLRHVIAVLVLLLLSVSARAAITLTAADPLTLATDSPVVRRAAEDVARDLKSVFGSDVAIVPGAAGRLVVAIDPALPGPEAYQIRVTPQGVRLVGSDELGAVYALYDFTHRYAGVDPLWYWTDRRPPRRAALELPEGTIQQAAPRFRYRGLFINDEDLLGHWQPPAGQRFLDYPDRQRLMGLPVESEYQRNLLVFYGPIINYEVMEAVYETVLRLHGNLIIPASFVDVLNPAEAELIRRAVARGLFVSQHHVEPLGVAFFAYLSYWKRQGRDTLFSYPSEREMFHQIWRAYAEKWHALAGDKVIWQLGLRGRGDRPAWTYDPNFDRNKAGEYVTDALAYQAAMIRQVDRRPNPPMTLTLWYEMSDLLEKKQVTVPPGVMLVHTDAMAYAGAQMNPSFDMPRTADRRHGAYLHVAVWGQGPHLVQGIDHERLLALVDEIAGKGDTHFAIVNASNIREHVLPLRTSLDRLYRADASSALETSVPPAAAPAYKRMIELQRFSQYKDMLMNDGRCRDLIKRSALSPQKPSPNLPEDLTQHAAALEALAREARGLKLSADDARFVGCNLADQSEILAGLYRAAAGVRRDDRNAGRQEASAALQAVRRVFASQEGRWAHWYAGDTKINVPYLQSIIEKPAPKK